MEENLDILESDTYDIIKEKLSKYQDGKYKKYILESDDFEFKYGFTIFDVEHKDKNKTLDAIAYCKDLGEDYIKTSLWLLQNTQYYPGLMRLEKKLFVFIKKYRKVVLFEDGKDYIILFEYFENKEDDELKSITLKYSRDNVELSNALVALKYYYNMDKLKEDLSKENIKHKEYLSDIYSNIETSNYIN